MRGLRTALVEHADFASGTSSRSSKLIHGGFRYLEQGDVRLVLEACRERERLRRLAPHLVRPQEFIFPVYEDGPVGRFKLAAGLWAYDLMAGLWNVHRHRMLSARATRKAEPALRTEGLRGAGCYWDCRTDDARLVLETILAAGREGAVAVSYARVAALLKEDGRLAGARLVDRLGGGEVSVRARVVVNATGPWVDTVAALDAPAPARLRLTKGVHVLVPRARVGNRAAVVLHAVQDGRVMFVIPWQEQTLVGTTDTDHEGGPDVPPVVEAADVTYLLETVNHYFPAARLSREDVTSAFAGLRPLIAPPAGAAVAPSSVSREEEIFASPSGLISIAGGKLTTHRLVAAAVVARDGNGLAPPVIGHLADRYGSRAGEVLHLVAADRRLADPIVPTLPDPRAEVLEAVEREGALTVEDVLRRRTQISLREESEGVKAAGEVAALMAGPLGWTPEAARAAAESYAAVVEEGRRRWR